jgi:hypothetical protein
MGRKAKAKMHVLPGDQYAARCNEVVAARQDFSGGGDVEPKMNYES